MVAGFVGEVDRAVADWIRVRVPAGQASLYCLSGKPDPVWVAPAGQLPCPHVGQLVRWVDRSGLIRAGTVVGPPCKSSAQEWQVPVAYTPDSVLFVPLDHMEWRNADTRPGANDWISVSSSAVRAVDRRPDPAGNPAAPVDQWAAPASAAGALVEAVRRVVIDTLLSVVNEIPCSCFDPVGICVRCYLNDAIDHAQKDRSP